MTPLISIKDNYDITLHHTMTSNYYRSWYPVTRNEACTSQSLTHYSSELTNWSNRKVVHKSPTKYHDYWSGSAVLNVCLTYFPQVQYKLCWFCWYPLRVYITHWEINLQNTKLVTCNLLEHKVFNAAWKKLKLHIVYDSLTCLQWHHILEGCTGTHCGRILSLGINFIFIS